MKGLLFVYALVAVGALGALWRPAIGLAVYIGFAVLRPQYVWAWAGNMDDLSLIVGVAMLVGWAARGFGDRHFPRGRTVLVALAVYALWTALSALQADDAAVAWAAIPNLAKIILPFAVGITTLSGETDARSLLWVIVIAQGYVAYEMNVSYLQGYNQAADGFGGMDNNFFGVALVATLGPAIALALSTRKWIGRGIAALCAALILHTILLTFSRGAMLGLGTVLLVSFVILPKKPSYLLAIVVVALLAIRLTGPQLLARYETTFTDSEDRDASAQSRLELWTDCLTVAAAHPLFGIGPYNWAPEAEKFGWSEGKSAHSVWMESAAEIGFLGVAALLTFYVATILIMWPVARSRVPAERPLAVLATGILASIAGYMVSGQFVSIQGLEIPFYLTMASIVLLKDERLMAPAALRSSVPPPKSMSVRRVAMAPAPVRLSGPRRWILP